MRYGLAWVGLAMLSTACSHPRVRNQPDRDATTYVRVENQLAAPYTMYVEDGAQRLRIGIANPLTATRLRIPPSVVFPATTLRFIAVPMGGSGAAISQNLAVTRGGVVQLILVR